MLEGLTAVLFSLPSGRGTTTLTNVPESAAHNEAPTGPRKWTSALLLGGLTPMAIGVGIFGLQSYLFTRTKPHTNSVEEEHKEELRRYIDLNRERINQYFAAPLAELDDLEAHAASPSERSVIAYVRETKKRLLAADIPLKQ